MDELVNSLANTQVDPTSLGVHPRFSQYMNCGRAAEQQAERRTQRLAHQQQRRFDHFNHLRKLADNEFDSDDDDMEEETHDEGAKDTQEQPLDLSAKKVKRNRYCGELMVSEWLVDIPDSLSDEWIMVPCPVGKRVLVVCSRNTTTAYTKGGRIVHQFKGTLPSRQGFTILDCILVNRTFYCLDILAWDGQVFSESPFDLRRFMLNSRVEETDGLRASGPKGFSFKTLPQCPCIKEQMEKLMQMDYPEYELDGLLFYHSQVQYEKGQNPLVGWLKPWMLPEILNVSVPEKYLQSNPFQTSKEFIEDFNEKHHHKSKINKITT